jgi:two-component system, NtrC family, response regulator HydG
MPSVLIVDDLLSIHEMLEAVIQPTGYGTAFATDGEKALARYKAEKYDLVLADIDMKPMDGITLLRQLRAHDPSAVVIIMTAYASTESAVQALKFGAFDYLQKPFRVDDLIKTLKRALEYRRFCTERPEPSSSLTGATGTGATGVRDIDKALVGVSAAHKKLVSQIRKLAAVRTPVLLQGEAGTGKTTIAELLHAGSAAADAPFVRIDCAQAADEGFHAGLIGQSGSGGEWITQAQGGTLLLQHIEMLSLEMQRELVGVLRANAHAFRMICTSDADLERLTEEAHFDDELFYRVASLPMEIPPLRERPEDIPALVKFFTVSVVNPNLDVSQIDFDPEAMAVLRSYPWPGNLTDLGQVITKIASTTEVRLVTADQLPMRIKDMKGWPSLAEYLALQEKHYIEQVLKACRGDKTKAARVLRVEFSRLG